MIANHGALLTAGTRIFNERNPLQQARLILSKLFEPMVEEIQAESEQLCAANRNIVSHNSPPAARCRNPGSGCRAVIQLSQWDERGARLSPVTHFVSAPRHPAFPHRTAVVDHGGSGTPTPRPPPASLPLRRLNTAAPLIRLQQ